MGWVYSAVVMGALWGKGDEKASFGAEMDRKKVSRLTNYPFRAVLKEAAFLRTWPNTNIASVLVWNFINVKTDNGLCMDRA